jgi:hypothetical protein
MVLIPILIILILALLLGALKRGDYKIPLSERFTISSFFGLLLAIGFVALGIYFYVADGSLVAIGVLGAIAIMMFIFIFLY